MPVTPLTAIVRNVLYRSHQMKSALASRKVASVPALTQTTDGRSAASLFLEFFTSRLAASAFSLGTFVLVTRGTTIETAGIYITAISYALLISILLDLGTGTHLVRKSVDGDPRREVTVFVATRAFLTSIAIVIGAVGVLVIFPPAAQPSGFASLAYVAGSAYAIAAPVGQLVGSARAFRAFTLIHGVGAFASILAVVMLIDDPSPTLLVAMYSASSIVSAVCAFVWVRRHMARIPLTQVSPAVRSNLREVVMLGTASGAAAIYDRIDQALVLRIAGSASSAYYGLATRITFQARLIPSSVQQSIISLLAHRLRTEGGLSPGEQRLIASTSMRTGLGVSLAVIAISDLAVYVLAGPAYREAITPLVILAVSLVSTSYRYVVAASAIVSGRDKMYLTVTLLALLGNVTANILVIDRYGINGAAVVGAVTELVSIAIIAEMVGPKGGATSLGRFSATLAVAAAAGAAKLVLVSSGYAWNVAGSVVLVIVAGLLLKSSLKLLRKLPVVVPQQLSEQP